MRFCVEDYLYFMNIFSGEDGLLFKYSCKVHLAQCIGKKKHQKRKEKKSKNQKTEREKNKMQLMPFILFWCDYILFYSMGTT